MSNSCIYDLDKFIVEYSFSFILVNKTPISIGGSTDIFGIDNAIVRLKDKPYIPGSSLKGVLRSSAERFARSIYGENNETVCNILNPKIELERKEKDANNYRPCLICEIFGGPTIASRIKVSNAELKEDYKKKVTDMIRRVSIDRITNAQAKGRLFDIEYVIPEQEFKWSLVIENIDLLRETTDERSKQLINIINYLIGNILKYGIEVGGKRSIGFGLLTAKLDEFKVYKSEIKEERGIKELIEGNDVTDAYRRRLGIE